MEYCRRLKIIRCQNKLKQYQVAEALGISRSAYCSYETGRRSIDLDTFIRLSKFYNLPLSIFLNEMKIDFLKNMITMKWKVTRDFFHNFHLMKLP